MQFKTGTFKKMASSYGSLSKNTRDIEAEGKENAVKFMDQQGVNNLYC